MKQCIAWWQFGTLSAFLHLPRRPLHESKRNKTKYNFIILVAINISEEPIKFQTNLFLCDKVYFYFAIVTFIVLNNKAKKTVTEELKNITCSDQSQVQY